MTKSKIAAALAALMLAEAPGSGFYSAWAQTHAQAPVAGVSLPSPVIRTPPARVSNLPPARLAVPALVKRWSRLSRGAGVAPARSSPAAAYSFGKKTESFLTKKATIDAGEAPPPVPAASDAGGQSPGNSLAPAVRTPSLGPTADARGPPAPSILEKAYRRQRKASGLATAAGLGAVLLLAAGAGAILYFSGQASTAKYYLGFFALAPVLSEMAQRLHEKRPKGLPKLDPVRYAELYRLVEGLSARAGIRTPELFLWEEESPNAGAVGVRLPLLVTKSSVLVTKSIVNLMPPESLAGVIGHELSHIRNNDVLIKMVSTLSGALPALALYLNASNPAISVPLAAFGLEVAGLLAAAAVMRSRETLADAGGALLAGSAGALAKGLVLLDVWTRTVHAANMVPVKGHSLPALVQDHPLILDRAERLRRIEDESAPRLSGRLGSGLVWAASLSALAGLLVPAVVASTMRYSWALFSAVALILLNLVFKVRARILKTLGPRILKSSEALLRDRMSAYLLHPDPEIRGWAVQGLRASAFHASAIFGMRALRRVLDEAERLEADPAIRGAMLSSGVRLLARERAIFKDSARKEVQFGKAMKRIVRTARNQGRVKDWVPGRRPLPFKVLLVASKSRPWLTKKTKWGLYAFHYLDRETGELFVSEPFWDAMTPRERIGFLFRERVSLESYREFKASGRIWAVSNPDMDAVLGKVRKAGERNGLPAKRLARIESDLVKKSFAAEPDDLGPAAVELKQAKAEDRKFMDEFRKTFLSRRSLLAHCFGALAAIASVQLGSQWDVAFFTFAAAARAFMTLTSVPQDRRMLPYTLLSLLIPFVLALAAQAWLPGLLSVFGREGAGLVLPGGLLASFAWMLVSGLQARLRKPVAEGRLGRFEAVFATVAACSLLGLSFKIAALFPFISALAFIALANELSRYGVRGAPFIAAAALVPAAAWAAALLGPPWTSVIASLLASHLLGKVLARGRSPVDDAGAKPENGPLGPK